MNRPSAAQWFAMDNELRTALGFVKYGLASLQAMGGANDFYALPLLLLATGLERMLKCALSFEHLNKTGAFPPKAKLRAYGHDLQVLLDRVLQCYTQEYLRLPAATADHGFLRGDRLFRDVLACITRFAQGGRYHDLNVVAGGPGTRPSPQDIWQQLELRVTKADPQLKSMLGHPEAQDELFKRINRVFVALVERCARALSRLFTLGPLGPEASRFLGHLGHFLFLTDRQLGTTDYRKAIARS